MKKFTLTLLTCLFILSPNVVMSETMDDLVKREGLYYKKFSDVPFTGKVTGIEQGKMKKGKKEGKWSHKNSLEIASLLEKVKKFSDEIISI